MSAAAIAGHRHSARAVITAMRRARASIWTRSCQRVRGRSIQAILARTSRERARQRYGLDLSHAPLRPRPVRRSAHSACADLAAGLADRTRMPVTLASIPACCLDALRPTLGRARESRIRDYAPAPPPAPMSSAPFLRRDDGRPDWAAMWGSFCELALYG